MPERLAAIPVAQGSIDGLSALVDRVQDERDEAVALLRRAREAGSKLTEALNKLGEYVEDDNPGRAVADAWTAGLLEAAGMAIREWAELDAAAAQTRSPG